MENQAATGAKHPAQLAIEPCLVGNIHAGMLRPDGIEGGVTKGKLEQVANVELDRDPAFLRQRPGDGNVVGREVDSANPCALFGGKQTRRAADAAASIEYQLARLDRRQARQFARGGKPAAMELVEGRQRIGREVARYRVDPGEN